MLRTCTLRMQEGLQASVQMWRQRALTDGVLPLPCPFFIACRFIVTVSSLFVHDAHYYYVVVLAVLIRK